MADKKLSVLMAEERKIDEASEEKVVEIMKEKAEKEEKANEEVRDEIKK